MKITSDYQQNMREKEKQKIFRMYNNLTIIDALLQNLKVNNEYFTSMFDKLGRQIDSMENSEKSIDNKLKFPLE